MADELVNLEDLPVEERRKLPYNHPILDAYAAKVEQSVGLPSGLLNALKNAGEKSNSDQVSPKQAKGVMQLIPGTQKLLGVADPTDPVQAIQGAAQYNAQNMKKLGTDDPTVLAAAYHAGPNSRAARGDFKGAPVTKSYAERVASYLSSAVPSANAATPSAKPVDSVQAPPSGVAPEDIPTNTATAADRAQYDPSIGGGTLQFGPWDTGIKTPQGVDRFLSGAGKFFVDTGHGIKQLVSKDQNYEGERERARLDAPLMRTGAGMAGYMGANGATLALPGAVIGSAAKAAIPAAVAIKAAQVAPAAAATVAAYGPGALSSAALSTLSPTTEEGQRAENAAWGAALGPVLQKAGSVVYNGSPWAADMIRKLPGAAADTVANVVQNGTRPAVEWVGRNVHMPEIPFLPGVQNVLKKSFNAEATPTDRQAVARAILDDVPVYPHQLSAQGTSHMTPGQIEGQKDAFTRAVNATMGQETGDIPGAISVAHRKLSDTYNTILNGLNVPLDNSLGARAAQIQRNYLQSTKLRAPNSDLDDAIQRLYGQIQQGGQLSGREVQAAIQGYAADAVAASRSGMYKGQPTGKPDHAAAQAFRDLSDLLEQHASQFMRPGDAQVFKQTNKQWRNMKTLEQVAPVSNGVEDYSPQALARKLKQSDSKAFLYNQGDETLSDLSKFGTKYMGMDANGPTTQWQRIKQSAEHFAPLLAGDVAGGYMAGKAAGANEPGHDNTVDDVAKYMLGMYLTHKATQGALKAMNPRINNPEWLNQPRGALSELARRSNVAPGVVGVISNRRNEGE